MIDKALEFDVIRINMVSLLSVYVQDIGQALVLKTSLLLRERSLAWKKPFSCCIVSDEMWKSQLKHNPFHLRKELIERNSEGFFFFFQFTEI